jgi:hypothetical protein
MKITNLLLILFLLGLSACSGEEKSFYMTNNDEEVTSVNCTTKNLKVRIDASQLNGYTGGDLRIQLDMMNDMSVIIGEGTGEMSLSASDIPSDKMFWIDLSENTPVTNTVSNKPYNIHHFCDEAILNRPNKCTVQLTYFEQDGDTERKVGYPDAILITNY